MSDAPPRVGLFVTCLVDLFRPSIGFAAVKLLEEAGCLVEVPDLQTCCGQPAYNSGDRAGTEDLARRVIEAFSQYDYVVAPSGSCAGMLKVHYPALFEDDPAWRAKAAEFAPKVHELVSFLTDIRQVKGVEVRWTGTAAYHDSCAGLRELGVRDQPRKLLKSVKGLSVKELEKPEECCGFGGTFCIKFSDISNAMAEKKAADITATGAELLLAGDLGCLMNLAGKLARDGAPIKVRHVAEILAGLDEAPAIGAEET